MEKKYTIITGHGKMDFVRTDDGTLVLKSVNERPLSGKLGKLGCRSDAEKKDAR